MNEYIDNQIDALEHIHQYNHQQKKPTKFPTFNMDDCKEMIRKMTHQQVEY